VEQNKINCVRLYLQLGADITIKDQVSKIVVNALILVITFVLATFMSCMFEILLSSPKFVTGFMETVPNRTLEVTR